MASKAKDRANAAKWNRVVKRVEKRAKANGYKTKRELAIYLNAYVAGFADGASGDPAGGR